MAIDDKTYSINWIPEESKIVVSGQLTLQTVMNYNQILDIMLGYTEEPKNNITLDISSLTLLNSSGIAAFALFVIKMRDKNKKLTIRASKNILWQTHNIESFKELNENIDIEFISLH